MATKRRREFNDDEDDHLQDMHVSNKKHTLDSDEEDSDEYEKDDVHDSDIEGGEEGVETFQDDVKITPFNMREELQEGHFDTDGHYHWDKNAEIKDNWLDNIDWVKVKTDKNYLNKDSDDDSNDSKRPPDVYNEGKTYSEVVKFMKPNETVQQTLQRLGRGRVKISSAERLRRKKLGIVDEAAEKITKFTELTNEILTRTGNMDIYQETYEQIQNKLNSMPSTSKKGTNGSKKVAAESFDMYADDFEEKEKAHLTQQPDDSSSNEAKASTKTEELRWEYKVKQDDTELHGPYSTEQMLKWSQDNTFKDGVYVRKVGQETNFYSSKRIDFDLYL